MKYSTIKVLEEFDWIKKRPSIYLGSTTEIEKDFFFQDKGKFEKTKFIPALHKLFDEVIENATDEYVRTNGEYANRISVTLHDDKSITVQDNGRGLEIEKHSQLKDTYIPEVIFTHLRSGSNFEDIREGTGVNGVGAVLVVLFSDLFELKTQSTKKSYTQTFSDMLEKKSEPVINTFTSKNCQSGTRIKFKPNFQFFGVNGWNEDIIKKKVIDLAFAYPGIKFRFNGERVYANKFKDLMKNFEGDYVIETSPQSQLILASNDSGLPQQHSIVNGALTYNGGTHIDYVLNEIILAIRPKIEKKFKVTLKPSDISNHVSLMLLVNITNPIFSSQSKDNVINTWGEVGPFVKGVLTDKLYRNILANKNIVNKIVEEVVLKQKLKDMQEVKQKQKKISKAKVEKLIDANGKNTKNGKDRSNCILFLTEGDSACENANIVRDPEIHGFLPLKGKVLNVHDLTPTKVLSNEEIKSILSSVGLVIGEPAENLRYGKIVILADEDHDGNCIKGLLINFFFKYWPELFKQNRIYFLKTPLYIAEKGTEKIYIYDQEQYKNQKDSLKGYKLTYFKGLGAIEEDSWDYFLNKNPQYVNLVANATTKNKLKVLFGKDTNLRKEWLGE